ncbi:hypothetical protein F4212_12950 [Candidatus Poribacteria bacterium]|nr:hypothetical protein [Candidatus Poribacteria bacterium]
MLTFILRLLGLRNEIALFNKFERLLPPKRPSKQGMKRILQEHFKVEQYEQHDNESFVLECLDDGKQRTYDYLLDNTGLSHEQLIKALRVLERQRGVKHNYHKEIHLRKYRINWGNW